MACGFQELRPGLQLHALRASSRSSVGGLDQSRIAQEWPQENMGKCSSKSIRMCSRVPRFKVGTAISIAGGLSDLKTFQSPSLDFVGRCADFPRSRGLCGPKSGPLRLFGALL